MYVHECKKGVRVCSATIKVLDGKCIGVIV